MYYIIDPKCANKVYDNEDFEIDLLEFKKKETAEYYLKYGILKKKSDVSIINVFTDGACSDNGYNDAKAGIGIYFSKNNDKNISKRIEGKQTNNTAELSAIIEVFDICIEDIKDNKTINIYSDSKYAIRCCTEYGEKCSKNDWCTSNKKNKKIPNYELVKKGYELCKKYPNVKIKHVKAHTSNTDILSIGNKMADKLASESLLKSLG
tara:strand:+ start:5736 stop:6356 length:621 start_codon:yes stop_codon:yes gene_type:complete